MTTEKNKSCERCGREINHVGRCLPCNYLYKHKAYFSGLRESEEYDKKHSFDIDEVKKIIEEKKLKTPKIDKINAKEEFKIKSGIAKDIQENECGVCGNKFDSQNGKYKICKECYVFYKKYGGVRSYQVFLIAFKLNDCMESKENYIQFVDNFNKFVDFYFKEE